jgi:hypothetical protein
MRINLSQLGHSTHGRFATLSTATSSYVLRNSFLKTSRYVVSVPAHLTLLRALKTCGASGEWSYIDKQVRETARAHLTTPGAPKLEGFIYA